MGNLQTIKRSELVENKAEGLNFHGFMINSMINGNKTHTCRKYKLYGARGKDRFYPGRIMYARETAYIHPETKEIQYAANFDIALKDVAALKAKGFQPINTIYMRRSLARLAIRISDVSVKKVQDLTHEERLAEGIAVKMIDGFNNYLDYEMHFYKYSAKTLGNHKASLLSFKSLWCKVNNLDSWDDNQPVWSLYFEPLIIID